MTQHATLDDLQTVKAELQAKKHQHQSYLQGVDRRYALSDETRMHDAALAQCELELAEVEALIRTREEERDRAHQAHLDAEFSALDLALRGNRDRREALNAALCDARDARDDILADAAYRLQDDPERLNVLRSTYGSRYEDGCTNVLEANLTYRHALAKVETILGFVGRYNVRMDWLEVQPSEDCGLRNEPIADIEAWLQSYRDSHSH